MRIIPIDVEEGVEASQNGHWWSLAGAQDMEVLEDDVDDKVKGLWDYDVEDIIGDDDEFGWR